MATTADGYGMAQWQGKTALVTGASNGIGAALAGRLLREGMHVVGCARRQDRVAEVLTAADTSGQNSLAVECDVRDEKSVQKAFAAARKRFGGVDVLINNAGVGITGPIEEIPEFEIKSNFETNFFGPINVIKAVLPKMREQRSGLIINITSIAGYMGLPYRGIYSASKGAFELVTEAFRMELKEFNIKMTNVAPGDFATNIASGRFHAPVQENSPYKKSYGNSLQLIDEHVNDGKDPLFMAKAVYKVMNTKQPKIHYKVGEFMQKFSIVLKRILPDKVYEKLLLNHYKL